jgi:hypothetical protein
MISKKAVHPFFLVLLIVLPTACNPLSSAVQSVKESATAVSAGGQGDEVGTGGDENKDSNDASDEGQTGGGDTEWGLDLSTPDESVPYGIYVGANVTGHCGIYTNSGGFESLTFDTEFHHIVFTRPSTTGLPGPFGGLHTAGTDLNVGMAGISPVGKGALGDFTLCPTYETEDTSYPNYVTSGPRPFEPSISLMTADPDVFPNVPLVGTPGPLGGGTSIILFSLISAGDMQPIMEWEGEMGASALGGAGDTVQAPFPVTWDQLMLGEEFSVDIITGDEGETWNWTMRFVPGY